MPRPLIIIPARLTLVRSRRDQGNHGPRPPTAPALRGRHQRRAAAARQHRVAVRARSARGADQPQRAGLVRPDHHAQQLFAGAGGRRGRRGIRGRLRGGDRNRRPVDRDRQVGEGDPRPLCRRRDAPRRGVGRLYRAARRDANLIPDPAVPVPGAGNRLMPMMVGRSVAAAGILLAALVPAGAQQYPSRSIMLVVPNPAGGSVDLVARAVADTMSRSLGQQVVVENRAAGASGTVATRQVARATPDGYTLLLGYTGNLGTGPSLYRNVGYDPRKDFAAIGSIASSPSLVLAHSSISAQNARELIALLKAAPEPFQIGSPGTGSVNYLTAALFAERARVKIQQIPYKGSHNMMTDLIGGHIKLGFNPIPVSRSALEGKLVRALAVTSSRRTSFMPSLPTLAEAGLDGFDAVLTYGLVAPVGTPKPIVERLNAALRAALDTAAVRDRLLQDGAEPMPNTPEQHAAIIDREETQWSAVVRLAGLQPQ